MRTSTGWHLLGAISIIAAALIVGGCGATPNGQRTASEEETPTPQPTEMGTSERIAFGRWEASENRDLPPAIWTANADGSDPRPVGDQRGWYMEWSPDRSHLLFDFVDDDGNEQIGRVNPDGSGFVQLTSGEAFYADPAYSSDAKQIAFTYSPVPDGDPDFHLQVWIMDADGSAPRESGKMTAPPRRWPVHERDP